MPVSAITASFASYAQKVTTGAAPGGAASATAQQEATESSAVTQREAQAGDRVAIAKLAHLQLSRPQAAPAEPGKGVQVDHHG